MSKNKTYLAIVSGSVASYRIIDIVKTLQNTEATVKIVLTENAKKFITKDLLEALNFEVYDNLFGNDDPYLHINLSRNVDKIIVCPASADFIARCATGRADSLTSAIILASKIPAVFFPAMNDAMWNNPAVQENCKKLESFGHTIIPPAEGDLACGEKGQGRLPDTATIIQHITEKTDKNFALKGTKSLVTVGSTQEKIDPVRFITNRSSGKQGFAIAKALQESGSEVTLVVGHATVPAPNVSKIIKVNSSLEMYQACMDSLPTDIAVCVAAVSDWRFKESKHKLKRGENHTFERIENPDILKALGLGWDETAQKQIQRPKYVAGFAAETENLKENALKKMKTKGADMIIANNVSQDVFGSDKNKALKCTIAGCENWERAQKTVIASQIVKEIQSKILNDAVTK